MLIRALVPLALVLSCTVGATPAQSAADTTSAHGARPDSVRARPLESLLSGAAAVADPLAATEQTVEDAVRWMSKRRQFVLRETPYGFTGLPIVYYSPGTGWNYGGRLQIADYDRRPYRYKLSMHWVKSTRGKRISYLRFKVPHIAATGFGVILAASNKRDIRARYYGLSNDSERNRNLTDPDHTDFVDEDYYHYVLEAPRLIVNLLRHLYGPLTLSLGFGLERTDVDGRGGRSYYRDAGTPDGVVDGITGFIGLSMRWDTRDDPTIPRRGLFQEWSYENSRNSLLSLLFEQIDFQRYTFTDARYWPVSPRVNIAHRTIVEALKGTVPLYAYGEIGGSRRIKGLGGSDTLRGFDRQRFTDNVRILTNTEARYHLGNRTAFKQHLELLAILFADSGQVAPGFSELHPMDTRLTLGGGLRTYWNEDFVVRVDLGISGEQVFTSLKYRNIF